MQSKYIDIFREYVDVNTNMNKKNKKYFYSYYVIYLKNMITVINY